MKITIPRGDYQKVELNITYNEDEIISLENNKDIIVTIKNNYDDKKILIQKLLSKGDIYIEDEKYVFTFKTQDTLNLKTRKYFGDVKLIELVNGEVHPETVELIELEVTKEATNISTRYNDLYND